MYTTRAKVVPHLDYGNVAIVDQQGFGVEALDGQAARPVRASYRGDRPSSSNPASEAPSFGACRAHPEQRAGRLAMD
jgi:hypothetical protein